jgi:hypothetical protein
MLEGFIGIKKSFLQYNEKSLLLIVFHKWLAILLII